MRIEGGYSECYKKNNLEKIRELGRNHYHKNKKKYQVYSKLYRQNNKDKIREKDRKYNEKNPHIKAWKNLLHHTLQLFGTKKEGKTIKLLGYSSVELRKSIKNKFKDGMSWENYGKWHIDHIKPKCSFCKSTHPSIVNNLNNLQPLWAKENLVKGVKYNIAA